MKFTIFSGHSDGFSHIVYGKSITTVSLDKIIRTSKVHRYAAHYFGLLELFDYTVSRCPTNCWKMLLLKYNCYQHYHLYCNYVVAKRLSICYMFFKYEIFAKPMRDIWMSLQGCECEEAIRSECSDYQSSHLMTHLLYNERGNGSNGERNAI